MSTRLLAGESFAIFPFATQSNCEDENADVSLISVPGPAPAASTLPAREAGAAALTPWRAAAPGSPAPQAPRPRSAPTDPPGAGAAAPPRVSEGARGRETKLPGRWGRSAEEGGGGRRGRRGPGTPNTCSEKRENSSPFPAPEGRTDGKALPLRPQPGGRGATAAWRECAPGVRPNNGRRALSEGRGTAQTAWGGPVSC